VWWIMNVSNVLIGDWLGVRSPPTKSEILRLVEERLSPTVIKRLCTLGVERKEIDDVVISSRTLQYRRTRHQKLTVEESDRVLRLIRVLCATESVFGRREKALAWLRSSNDRLGGRSPFSLLKTDVGSRVVEEQLIQIDEGIFV
jgi:putative toxin-antitoxin system antitoxin component (TIGR02293 family)